MGLGDCFGVDARVSKAVHAPVLKLDLLTRSGQDSLFALLNLHTVVAVHVSPPCRTTCRSQDKEHPLRSEAHPAGVPDLQPQQLVSVQEANTLISCCSKNHKHILAPVTKDLVRQPALCRAWAECLQRALLSHGATEAPKSVADITSACAAAQGAPYATNGPRVPYGCPCFRTCLCLTRRP